MSNPKSDVFEQFAVIARVLGQANRLELIEHAAQGERPVERLAELANLSVANTSRHLQVLRRAGLLRARREGKQMLYRLGDGPVLEVVSALRRCAEHVSGEMRRVVSDYFQRLDALEPVSRQEIARRVKEGSVLLLDVRPADEFALGHLPGALSIPLGQLARGLSKLPKRLRIVAYCRGPYCVLSFEAVAALRAKGYDARRLEDGYPEWKMAGLPVEAAASGAR